MGLSVSHRSVRGSGEIHQDDAGVSAEIEPVQLVRRIAVVEVGAVVVVAHSSENTDTRHTAMGRIVTAHVVHTPTRRIGRIVGVGDAVVDGGILAHTVRRAVLDVVEVVDLDLCHLARVAVERGFEDDLVVRPVHKKSAAIARANSEKEIKIAQARANKEANDERVLAETEIAKKNNDLAIKSAELKKESDIKKAEADAAYKIQEEQQRKELEITSANANIARQEREVELRAREVEVTEKSLEAEVKKKAEAERYAKQQQAEADLYRRQKDAEADQFEKIREAEAKKAQAEAQRYAMEQEALGIKAKGEAEAASIRAQALAEAEGMEKKAEAYQRYNKAAMAETSIYRRRSRP